MNALFGDIASVTGNTVTLADGRTARFDPADERSAALASLVENVRRLPNPIYLELDPVSEWIRRVRIPRVLSIDSLTDTSVTFNESAARHVIDRDLADVLRTHQHRRLAITTDESGSIIDVHPYD